MEGSKEDKEDKDHASDPLMKPVKVDEPASLRAVPPVQDTQASHKSVSPKRDISISPRRTPPRDKSPIISGTVTADDSSSVTNTYTLDSEAPDAPGSPYSSFPSSFIQADDTISDEGYAESTSSSFVSSIASDIRRGIEENGRIYAAYGQHKPWVPVDDAEMDRNDFQHCKFTLLMGNELHLAPIVSHPQRILDLGTGSGIWAIDMAEKHPSAAVIGVDTAAVQPNLVPPNLQFEIEDIQNDWLWQKNSYDFIHARELVLAIRDWPRLVEQSFETLKPGGYLQIAGSLPAFTSDDGTLPPGTAYVEISEIFFEMGQRIGASGKEPYKWKQYLLEAGFTDVQEIILKIPTNPWPKDPRMKQIGAFELLHFRDGIANIFARGYTQILGGDPAYFEVLMARARKEVLNRKMHSYLPFYVVYGRKPEI